MNGRADHRLPAIAERVHALCPQRQRLLAQRLGLAAENGGETAAPSRIVAWIKPAPSVRPGTGEATAHWRDFLHERLPAYMIPNAFEVIEDIPRLANGKVDRAALRQAPRTTADSARRGEELAGPVEIMQGIWRQVLQADEVYPDDDFFELGGDSLMSINVVARAREQGVELKPSQLFDFPRLADLCAHIAEEARERHASPGTEHGRQVRSKNVEGSLKPFFMVHGGARLLSQLRDSLGPEQPIHLLSAHWEEGNLSRDVALEELAAEALAILLEIQPRGPYALGGYSFGAVISYEIARQLIAREETVDLLFMLDPPENPQLFSAVPDACRQIERQQPLQTAGETHLQRLRGMTASERTAYVSAKLRSHLQHYLSRVMINARQAYALARRRLGYPIPPELRKLYVFRCYLAAASRYALEPIDCPVLLYRAAHGYHKFGTGLWEALARGELSVEEFDCEHDDLQWNPEIVGQWTERLGRQFSTPDQPTAPPAAGGAAADSATERQAP